MRSQSTGTPHSCIPPPSLHATQDTLCIIRDTPRSLPFFPCCIQVWTNRSFALGRIFLLMFRGFVIACGCGQFARMPQRMMNDTALDFVLHGLRRSSYAVRTSGNLYQNHVSDEDISALPRLSAGFLASIFNAEYE